MLHANFITPALIKFLGLVFLFTDLLTDFLKIIFRIIEVYQDILLLSQGSFGLRVKSFNLIILISS